MSDKSDVIMGLGGSQNFWVLACSFCQTKIWRAGLFDFKVLKWNFFERQISFCQTNFPKLQEKGSKRILIPEFGKKKLPGLAGGAAKSSGTCFSNRLAPKLHFYTNHKRLLCNLRF